MVPKNLRYAETHEWALVEGDVCTIGITKFAVEQLTDVVYIEKGTNRTAKGVDGIMQVAHAGTPGQVLAAERLLEQTRRELYRILAGDAGEPGQHEQDI